MVHGCLESITISVFSIQFVLSMVNLRVLPYHELVKCYAFSRSLLFLFIHFGELKDTIHPNILETLVMVGLLVRCEIRKSLLWLVWKKILA